MKTRMNSVGERCLGANHFTFEGRGCVILKKKIYIMRVHMRKKKISAQDHCPQKISRTYSGLEKNSGKMFAETLNFCISKLLKDFSIWTWVFI